MIWDLLLLRRLYPGQFRISPGCQMWFVLIGLVFLLIILFGIALPDLLGPPHPPAAWPPRTSPH